MKKEKNRFCRILSFTILFFALIGWMPPAHCQETYPVRSIELINPFAPGGATDLSARVVAGYLTKKWGVPVNVINKPGGNTVPANTEVYNAKPDGYTVLNDSLSSASMVPVIVKDLPFKVLDRTFIAMYSLTPLIFLVPSSSSIKNMKDLEATAKKDPANFTWTSLGGASQLDYGTRQFLKAIGVDVSKTKPVMSQSGAQAAALISGGHVTMGSAATSSAIPAIKGGFVRPLAITSKIRYPVLPDVPTTEEVGYPTVNVVNWNGVSGPPNLPSHIVDKWDKAIQEMLNDEETISKMINIGGLKFYLNSRDTRQYVAKEIEEVSRLLGLK